ncbi:Methyltransferase type 11 [Leadbetterella byssophila DSM 17132]|uniref:Methyltransferase type 11 n=1 Tax=Leadbetterella byssophila (strain DSM 17132 / JCM 16389 / KACC 11308 / NBRC 106382 / 4M15) TaxID=649349 RepID=E4RWN3_LEAB4|nr:class I SAM-dependent methyltransferase [Leadbetterella byssophila]ADQ16202.1 Methyltransferase type 11 [Leadbetterella byssophila DSM 17132]
MKENKYDDLIFFEQYEQMNRSQKGLEAAGEWHVLKDMLPDFSEKDILDLGCGFGWHCRYAIEKGARSVVGVDISEKMLEKAKKINSLQGIEYVNKPLEDVDYPDEKFDIVLSSLTFHYIESFDVICKNVYNWLKPKGCFVFSVEHPIFTAFGNQDWIYGDTREKLYWPVDNYFKEGKREAVFLGEKVIKYHKTLTNYINTLLRNGFKINELIEPQPSEEMLKDFPEMKDEMRRPMMLLVSAEK